MIDTESQYKFLEASSTSEIATLLQNISHDTVIFIDIDDTIITPLSNTFRAPPYNQLIDDIKQNRELYPNFEDILSNWRLKRKIILLDQKWPTFITRTRENFRVFGLTKMDTGKIGKIISTQDWRYQELKSREIEFSKLNVPISTRESSLHYNGIFFTGLNSKSKTIELYKKDLGKIDNIVLIDDRLEHLLDLRQFCIKNNIEFIGILFKGLESLNSLPNKEIYEIQKEYLIHHTEWLEDNEAIEKITSKNNNFILPQ